MTYLLALDQGTSSSRSIVFDASGQVVSMAQQELPQIYPQPGWVEHDPVTIWQTQLATAKAALAKAGITARQVHALGITNQRETSVVWNRRTGQPIHHAIVWQDRRAEPTCADLRARGHEALVQTKTGLLIDAYFSGTKLRWLLDHVPGARAQAESGELAFGTVDSWLIWQLTGGAVHATDVSNASRTMLFNVHRNQWDAELLELLDIPAQLMPKVYASSAHYGELLPELLGHAITIGGVAGDQQSALFGQACFKAGMVKNTYGTGCFMLMHTGPRFQSSGNGLITTSAAQVGPQAEFALEGQRLRWRRCGAVAARWAERDIWQQRGRGAGPQRARRWWRDDGAGLYRPWRTVLEARGPRHHHRSDTGQHLGPHCPRCAGEHCLPKRRPAAVHESRRGAGGRRPGGRVAG